MHVCVEQLLTESDLPPLIENGNPDRIEVKHLIDSDFRDELVEQLAEEALMNSGQISSSIVRNALQQPANRILKGEDERYSILLRSEGALRRPSGRISGVAFCQWLIRAERVQISDEEGGSAIEIAFSRPQVFSSGLSERPEVYEASLLHLLRQLEHTVVALVNSIRLDGFEAVAWTSPASAREEPFLQEAHRRMIQLFYTPYASRTRGEVNVQAA